MGALSQRIALSAAPATPSVNVSQAASDHDRLAALWETELLDTPPEEGFDRITRLAARLLRVPITVITLVDEDRQFFKSAVGLPEPWASTREAPLSYGYNGETLARRAPLVIEDARTDPHCARHHQATDFGMVAYAGVPLLSAAGQPLGTLAAMDDEPRRWTAEELETLSDLAESARLEIELRRATSQAAAIARRARVLAEAGVALASSLDYRTTLAQVARIAVPAVADYCIADVRDQEGLLQRGCGGARRPGQAGTPRRAASLAGRPGATIACRCGRAPQWRVDTDIRGDGAMAR